MQSTTPSGRKEHDANKANRRHASLAILRLVFCMPLCTAPARIRTWNASLEAKHDVRFTTGAVFARAEGEGVEPSFRRTLIPKGNRFSKAARQTVCGCLPPLRARESHPACGAYETPLGTGPPAALSSSSGIRTRSIPGSKPKWSANCLPSRQMVFSRVRHRQARGDGIEPPSPGSKPGGLPLADPRPRPDGSYGNRTRLFALKGRYPQCR